MPTVTELISDIDERVPNLTSLSRKIDWMNKVQNQLHRLVPNQSTLEIVSVANVSHYNLSEGCNLKNILSVVVGNKHYPYKRYYSSGMGAYCYAAPDNKLGIFPTPEQTDIPITIIYNKPPTPLSDQDLSYIPDLLEDYHELLVYGVIIRIAKVNEDVDLANAYTADFEELLMEMRLQSLDEYPAYPSTEDVMKRKVPQEEW